MLSARFKKQMEILSTERQDVNELSINDRKKLKAECGWSYGDFVVFYQKFSQDLMLLPITDKAKQFIRRSDTPVFSGARKQAKDLLSFPASNPSDLLTCIKRYEQRYRTAEKDPLLMELFNMKSKDEEGLSDAADYIRRIGPVLEQAYPSLNVSYGDQFLNVSDYKIKLDEGILKVTSKGVEKSAIFQMGVASIKEDSCFGITARVPGRFAQQELKRLLSAILPDQKTNPSVSIKPVR